jgi:hypothetical protein
MLGTILPSLIFFMAWGLSKHYLLRIRFHLVLGNKKQALVFPLQELSRLKLFASHLSCTWAVT